MELRLAQQRRRIVHCGETPGSAGEGPGWEFTWQRRIQHSKGSNLGQAQKWLDHHQRDRQKRTAGMTQYS